MLELTAKDFCHVYFPRWFEIRGGCGVLHKVIYINSAGIIFEVILEKSNNEGAMIVYSAQAHDKLQALLLMFAKHVKTLLPLQPNALMLLHGPLSRPDSSSNPLNKLLPSWLAALVVLKIPSSSCPCHMHSGPALLHRLSSSSHLSLPHLGTY